MTQGRLSESVYIYQYFFKNSNSTHQVKLRVTLKTDTWGKHLANKDSSTYSNVAQKHIMQQKLSRESCHQGQSVSVICRSPSVQTRETLTAGAKPSSRGKSGYFEFCKGQNTIFARDGQRDKFSHAPKGQWPLQRQHLSPWQQGLSTTHISVWFATLSQTLAIAQSLAVQELCLQCPESTTCSCSQWDQGNHSSKHL